MKLHLGCGGNVRPGWVNLDMVDGEGVDVVFDLDSTASGARLPFDDDTFDEIEGVDLVEHLREPLAVMGELWRVAKPGAGCHFVLPYGASDDAWEDPTHRRPYFLNSWAYFSQPAYWRADYGYVADWQVGQIFLKVDDASRPDEQLFGELMALRNVCKRQSVNLSAVKPARPRDRALLVAPTIHFVEA